MPDRHALHRRNLVLAFLLVWLLSGFAHSQEARAQSLNQRFRPRTAYANRIHVDTTTAIGGWESQAFDPAKCYPLGVWEQIGGDSSAPRTNRQVLRINPFPGNDVPNYYLRTANSASWFSPMHTSWADPYERWRCIWTGWAPKLAPGTGQYDHVVNWLRPNWFDGPPTYTTADQRPLVAFVCPHGRWGDSQERDMSFYSAVECRAWGLNHLVDGFYEACKRLDAMGVKIIKHDGSPGLSERYLKQGVDAFREQDALNQLSNAAIALDAVVTRPEADAEGDNASDPDGIDERTGDAYWSRGQGTLMEGIVVGDTDPSQHWLTKSWPICTFYPAMADRWLSPQAGFAVGHYPVIGTSPWNTLYGANRWIVVYVAANEADWGLTTFDASWGSNATADAYLAAYIVKIKAIYALHAHTIVMIPHNVASLAAKRGVTAASFLP